MERAHLWQIAASADEARAALLAEHWPGSDEGTTLIAHEAEGGWTLALRVPDGLEGDWGAALTTLAPSASAPASARPEPDDDWLARAERGLPPVNAGRWHLHAGRGRRPLPGQWPLRLDAGRAFGTGRHDTTRGCLLLLQRLARRQRPARIADIGTGSAVLAMAARRLWPGAAIVGGEIDAAALATARANLALNRQRAGRGAGRTLLVRAAGLAGGALAAPHDLVLANILAGPLARMAPAIGACCRPSGHVVLAGLLAAQERGLVARYRARGFVCVARLGGAWPVLLLERRGRPVSPAGRRARAFAGVAPVRASTAAGGRARPADHLVL